MCDDCHRQLFDLIDRTLKERLQQDAQRARNEAFAKLRALSRPRGFLETLLP